MPERMNIVIDEDLARTLRETALRKFGKLRGASLVIDAALRRYFQEEGIEIESLKKTGNKEDPCRAPSVLPGHPVW
jgi:Arc/MetJ family transcription regulator